MFDILIKDARIVDGTGNPWFRGNVVVNDGRIVTAGATGPVDAAQVIEARGQVLCPGFIDIHSHSDRSLVAHNKGLGSLQQGITTQVGGNCGHSLAPMREGADALSRLAEDYGYGRLELNWQTFAEYLDWQEGLGVGINFVSLVGHGAVRRFVMGPEGEGGEQAEPSPGQLEEMRGEVAAAMTAGAYGMSTGLEYPPGRNARTAELVELCRVVAAHDGFHATHMRSEGQAPGMEWWGAIVEAIETGRRAGVRVHISHLKSDQRGTWDKTEATLRLLDDARRNGVMVSADVYPWPYAAVGYLYEVLPPALSADGLAPLLARLDDPEERARIRAQLVAGVAEWTNPATSFGWGAIGIVETGDPSQEGLSVEDLAQAGGVDPLDVCFDLLLRDKGLTRSSVGVMSEDNIARKLAHHLTAVSTDGFTLDTYPAAKGPDAAPPKVHPRSLATYPRLFERYVRQRGVLRLEEAVRKSTSWPARIIGLRDRGLVAAGCAADLVVFDDDRLGEQGTFADPHHPPRGIGWVLVNGAVAVADGTPTGILAGRVLRRGRD